MNLMLDKNNCEYNSLEHYQLKSNIGFVYFVFGENFILPCGWRGSLKGKF